MGFYKKKKSEWPGPAERNANTELKGLIYIAVIHHGLRGLLRIEVHAAIWPQNSCAVVEGPPAQMSIHRPVATLKLLGQLVPFVLLIGRLSLLRCCDPSLGQLLVLFDDAVTLCLQALQARSVVQRGIFAFYRFNVAVFPVLIPTKFFDDL
jgi:hypothetical protein